MNKHINRSMLSKKLVAVCCSVEKLRMQMRDVSGCRASVSSSGPHVCALGEPAESEGQNQRDAR